MLFLPFFTQPYYRKSNQRIAFLVGNQEKKVGTFVAAKQFAQENV